MAESIPMLRREQRRHLLMNGWLIAGFIVVGTAVTNERGIFRPLGLEPLSASARAFLAIASPAGLAPRLRDIRSVSSMSPFDVTGPSRDLRRRLIDAIDSEPGGGAGPNQDPLAIQQGIPNPVVAMNDIGNDTPTPQAFTTPPSQLGISPQALPPTTNAITPVGEVPEPAMWAMLIAGFGIVGASLRALDRGRRSATAPIARRRKGQRAATPAI